MFQARNPNAFEDPIWDFRQGKRFYIPKKDLIEAALESNMANPFQQEFLRSFQGKNADDVRDQYPPEILDSLRKEGYRIDGTGDAQSNPNYNKLFTIAIQHLAVTTE